MCKFAVYSNSPLLPPKKNKFAPIPVGFHFSIFLGRWSSVVIEKVGVPLRRLRGRGQGSLGALTLGSQATDSALVSGHVLVRGSETLWLQLGIITSTTITTNYL